MDISSFKDDLAELVFNTRSLINQLNEEILGGSSAGAFWSEVGNTRFFIDAIGKQLYGDEALERICETFSFLRIPSREVTKNDAKRTLQVASYLITSQRAVDLAQQVNESKLACKHFITGMPEKNIARRNSKVREFLASTGEGDISLSHLYRKITIVYLPVTKLRWRYDKKNSVISITPADAIKELNWHKENNVNSEKRDELFGILDEQINALASLPQDNDDLLVKVIQSDSRSLKVHPSFETVQLNSKGRPLYPALPGALPVLLADQAELPSVSLPDEENSLDNKGRRLESNRDTLIAPNINVWHKK